MLLKQRLLYFLSILVLSLTFSACGNDETMTGAGNDFNHNRQPGASAEAFLQSDLFNSLYVEVDYAEGYVPEPEALDNLESFLEERLNKPGGIRLILDDEIPAANDTSITAAEVVGMESEYRDQYSSDSQLAAYLIILDGTYEQDNVLGIAYQNTSMAIFSELIAANTGGFGQPSVATVETTVMQHEFGHILGLVDNGTPAVSDHVDEENGAHCTNDACLMYYAVQNAGFIGNLGGGSIPELDADCLEDLSQNGGK